MRFTGLNVNSLDNINYEFYLEQYELEEKIKTFKRFTELYEREYLTDKEKEELIWKIKFPSLKIILSNLEILIFYLVQENKYQGTQKINQINLNTNLYLDEEFIEIFKFLDKFTINKLISIYEILEEKFLDSISERYINKQFKLEGFSKTFETFLDNFYENESKRELKNNTLISLLIKFICRDLPNEPVESKSYNLFKMIVKKNINLSTKIQRDLIEMDCNFEAHLYDAIDITIYLINRRKIEQKEKNTEKTKTKNKIGKTSYIDVGE